MKVIPLSTYTTLEHNDDGNDYFHTIQQELQPTTFNNTWNDVYNNNTLDFSTNVMLEKEENYFNSSSCLLDQPTLSRQLSDINLSSRQLHINEDQQNDTLNQYNNEYINEILNDNNFLI